MVTKAQRREIRQKLPERICGNLRVSCGRRHKDKSCRVVLCAYNVSTLYLHPLEQAVLLAYVKEGV